jgi:hypothetical protein
MDVTGEYSMVMRWDGLPLDLVGRILSGIDRAAACSGYTAVFREETGFGTVYFVPRPDGGGSESV